MASARKIVYFYVVDQDQRLLGVVPTRRIADRAAEQRISNLMIDRVVTIPHTATLLEACEAFVLHKFLAFPLVMSQRRWWESSMSVCHREVFDLAEREQMDEVFEAIGFRVSQVRDAAPLRAFRFRFPCCWPRSGADVCAFL